MVVFAAFLIMVLLGNHFGSGIVKKHISNYGDGIISVSAETIKRYLEGCEIMLNDSAVTLEGLRARVSDADAMQEELVRWSQRLGGSDERYKDVKSFYGVVDGAFISSFGWEPTGDYTPESRMWYTGAQAAAGGVFYTDPYVDAYTGKYVISLSKLLFDGEGNAFGVISLDVFVSSILDYIGRVQLMESGYGVLLDSKRRVITHPLTEIHGEHMENIAGGNGYAEMANILMAGKDISAFNFTSVLGSRNIAFIKKLFNGWYIGLALPGETYYKDVEIMRTILCLTGAISALFLCGVLTFMHVAKNRSDSASQVKSSFLANMSHEIRTPMNSILGISEIQLRDENLSPAAKEAFVKIYKAGDLLLSIINDILDLSKIEAGKLELVPAVYNIPSLVNDTAQLVRLRYDSKDLEFTLKIDENTPLEFIGDQLRIKQILNNILSNAFKYTNQGSIEFSVAAEEEAKNGEMALILKVEDTGVGLTAEQIQTIFEEYTRFNPDNHRGPSGAGLGMSITKRLVDMMNGRVSIESIPGKGSTFTIRLPQKRVESRSAARTWLKTSRISVFRIRSN